PIQVRYPTDRQFVSGCSPPCLTATQLPSTTRSWLASTRTSTALMRCPLGRTDPGLRRDDDVVESRQIQREHGLFVAVCYPPSSLRRRPESRPLRTWRAAFCLDPGLRRDDDVVESRRVQRGHGRFVAVCYRPSSARRRPESRPRRTCRAAFCLDPGLRRDDDVVESRQIQRERGLFVAMCYPPSSLRRRPESRPLRAWRAVFCLDPGLRRDDNVLKS